MDLRLYEPYPESVIVDGKEYALDLDFRNVLRFFDLRDDGWTETEQIELGAHLLLMDPSECPADLKDQANVRSAIFELFPNSGEKSTERFLDMKQDAAKIRSGFYRIGIDLTRDRLHWFRFIELLGDLPSDTALVRTIELRQRPIPKPNKHNANEIAELQRAKAKVAIKYTDEERRRHFYESLKNSTLLRGGER